MRVVLEKYRYPDCRTEDPFALIRATSTLPTAPGGTWQVRLASLITVTAPAVSPPKVIVFVPAWLSANPEPMRVTVPPPDSTPAEGTTALTTGSG